MSRHGIDDVNIDFHFTTESDAWHFMRDADAWVKHALFSSVERVLDDFDTVGQTIRFDELEVDLGTLSLQALLDDGGEILEQKLRALLADQVARYQHGQDSQLKWVFTDEQKGSHVYLLFLQQGHAALPQSDDAQDGSFDQWIQGNLNNRGHLFIRFLLRQPRAQFILTRLLLQCERDTLALFLSVYSRNPPPAELQQRESQWIHAALDQRFAHEKTPDAIRLWQVSNPLLAIPKDSDMVDTVPNAIDPTESDSHRLTLKTKQQQARLEKLLIASVATQDTSKLIAVWWLIVRQYPLLLKRFLRRHVNRVETQEVVARLYSEPMLLDCISVLNRDAGSFMEQVMSQADTIHIARQQLVPTIPASEASSSKTTKQALWQVTLAYLLVDHGSHFNRKQFIRSLIRDLAARFNVTAEQLGQEILLVLRIRPAQNRDATSFSQLLSDILQPILRYDDPKPETREVTEQTDADIDTEFQQRLTAAVRGDTQVSVSTLLADATAGQLEWFVSLLRQFASDHSVIQRLVQSCTTAQLTQLLTVVSPHLAEVVSEFIQQPIFRQRVLASQNQTRVGVSTPELVTREAVLWEASFHFALSTRGSDFSVRVYIRYMLQKIANHHNIRANDLLLTLIASLESIQTLSSRDDRLLRVMLSLRNEFTATISSRSEHKNGHVTTTAESAGGTSLEQSATWETWRFGFRVYQLARNWLGGGRSSRLNLSELRELQVGVQAPENPTFFSSWQWLVSVTTFDELLNGLYRYNRSWARRLITHLTNQTSLLSRYTRAECLSLMALTWACRQSGTVTDIFQSFDRSILGQNIKKVVASDSRGEVTIVLLKQVLAGDVVDLKNVTGHHSQTTIFDSKPSQSTLARDDAKQTLRDDHATDDARHREQDRSDSIENTQWMQSISEADVTVLADTFMSYLKTIAQRGWLSFADFLAQSVARGSIPPLTTNVKSLSQQDVNDLVTLLMSRRTGKMSAALRRYLNSDQIPLFLDGLSDKTVAVLFERESPIEPSRLAQETLTEAQFMELMESQEFSAAEAGDSLYIHNAGLVIVCAYLPRLFDMLSLTKEGLFVTSMAQERGVHLIQWLVTGSEETVEPALALNKLLCGMPLSTPIVRRVGITDDEKTVLEGLLKGVLHNWAPLKSTSIDGLRESFLCRDGVLRITDDGYSLHVENKPFDMLLDQLPWNFTFIKFPWMAQSIQVEWR
ncbi:contractile injection system tape measure protein [Reinekea sp. G2M2-21]|uniref:contractile injection system tape measure protein n=1 Tax=Reinekea sp. G2M2-21 TaxID=2788942 RepID=UPI0018AA6A08|nr:contractile injection system tape measure protein [Reinekea sp. G2M2-21]